MPDKDTETEAIGPQSGLSPIGVYPQFSLRGMFVAMTGLAVACGLAAWQGFGTLMASLGLLLALLNVTGHLQYFQTKKTRPKCFYLAWGLLLTSLLLPSVEGCHGPMSGWEVALAVAEVEARGVREMLEQDNEQPFRAAATALSWYGLLNLANVLLLFSPLFLYRLQHGRGEWFGSALAVCSIVAWSVGWYGGFLIGYYFWCLGFAALLIAYRISWLTFGLMLAYLPVVYLVTFVES